MKDGMSGKTTGLLDGLTNDSPKNPDASMQLPKGPSVDSDATRKDVAKAGNITAGRKA